MWAKIRFYEVLKERMTLYKAPQNFKRAEPHSQEQKEKKDQGRRQSVDFQDKF